MLITYLDDSSPDIEEYGTLEALQLAIEAVHLRPQRLGLRRLGRSARVWRGAHA
jgi:hypothetical protein